jgi:putative addiction module component (TIGR02574 family)
MKDSVNIIIGQALKLSESDRSDLVEKLLSSLDAPDSSIEAIWANEADARVEAFERGEIKSKPAEEVFRKYQIR